MAFGQLSAQYVYDWGKEDYNRGLWLNPFCEPNPMYYHWEDGWLDAQEAEKLEWDTGEEEAEAATKH